MPEVDELNRQTHCWNFWNLAIPGICRTPQPACLRRSQSSPPGVNSKTVHSLSPYRKTDPCCVSWNEAGGCYKQKKKKKNPCGFSHYFFFSTKQLVLLLFWIPSATCWHLNFCHICKYYSHFSLSLSPSLHKFGKDKVFVMFRVWSTETGMCALEALLL